MNDFYSYLSNLEPEQTPQISGREKAACRKAVIKEIRQNSPEAKKTARVRPSLRIALAASVTALAVSAVIPATVNANRPDWRETYHFGSTLTHAEMQQDMETLSGVLISDAQSCSADGYTLTMTGYAADGVTGMVFFELTVPEGFDWQYPYLEAVGTQRLLTDGQEVGAERPASLSYLTGLTKTDRPNVLCAECRLALSEMTLDSIAEQQAFSVHFPQISLRDEYTDFNDAGNYLSGSANPHYISFDADFVLHTEPMSGCIEREDDSFGNVRITPLGVYYYSFDDPAAAENYENQKNGLTVTLKNGTVYSPDNCPLYTHGASVDHASAEDIAVMEERGEDRRLELRYGKIILVFPRPVSLADIAEIGFAPYNLPE